MASQISGYIGKLNPGDGIQYSLGSTAYGVCSTAANTAAKTVDMTGFTLMTGATVFIKFTNTNSANNPTLNINNTGAKSLIKYGTESLNWQAGAVLCLTYDGTYWVGGSVTLQDLGLSNAMHFIGKATVNITDGGTENPTITGYDFTNDRRPGDVVIGLLDGREYVWTIEGQWELLGQDVSTTVDSGASTTNTWISRIQQNSDRTITVETGSLDTSGIWSGKLSKTFKVKLNNTQYTYDGSANVDLSTIYAPTAGGTANTQALVGNGATATPKWVNISPSISITAGTSSATPKVNVTVLGQSGTAQAITTATTGVYGATKLTDAYTSTDATLAATGKSILAAIQTLAVSAVGGGTGEYISKISETDGKIVATKTTTTVSNTWTDGTTAGPTIKTTVNGIDGTAVAIPSASASVSGVITTAAQTFAGDKTFQGNIFPAVSDSYNLGSTALRWKFLYGVRGIDLTNTGATGITVNNTDIVHSSSYKVDATGLAGIYDDSHTFWVLSTDQPYGDTWLKSKANRNIIFERNDTENARFDTTGHFIPGTTKTFNLGSTAKKWNNIYNKLIYADYYISSSDITSRLNSLDFSEVQRGGAGKATMRIDLVSSSITDTSIPPSGISEKVSAGYALTFNWDTADAMSQLYIPNGDHIGTRNGPQGLAMRGYDSSSGTWTDWVSIPTLSAFGTVNRIAYFTGPEKISSGSIITDGSYLDPVTTNTGHLGSVDNVWNTAYLHDLQLMRKKGVGYGKISWYSNTYYTWYDYMSDAANGACPTGGKPGTLGNVTSWARRSIIENVANYGWTWEAAANSAASANTVQPTTRMALSSNDGTLTLNGKEVIEYSNNWLTPSRLQLGRYDTTAATSDRAIIGVTDGNLHIDSYDGKEIYLQYYASNKYVRSGHIRPLTNNAYNLGDSSLKWANIYMTTAHGALDGNATTSSYPLGFTGRSAGETWGNLVGNSITFWNTTNGGAVSWRYDNPQSGQASLKLDGTVYINEGMFPVLAQKTANGFPGFLITAETAAHANNVYNKGWNDTGWLRTTSNGFIPYQSGAYNGGHSSLGTSSWYFAGAYIQNTYVQNLYCGAHNGGQIGSNTVYFNAAYPRTISTRHIDAGSSTISSDYGLYIGYGALQPTKVTHMYYSADTSSRTEFFQINSNGSYALTRFGVNGQNTSYNLYVNGTTFHTNHVYFGNGTTYYINNSAIGYLPDLRVDQTRLEANWLGFYTSNNAGGNRLGYIQGAAARMYFRIENGQDSFNFNGNIVPSSSGAANIGVSGTEWNNVYARNHEVSRNGQWYANMYIQTIGTANSGDGNATQGTVGVGTLRVGNGIARPASGTAGGANNAIGIIRIYAENTNYTEIRSQAGCNNKVFYLPNYTAHMYAVHAGNNNAVGSATQPVYVAANGRVTACTAYGSGAAGYLSLPRVTQDYNTLPGNNLTMIKEYHPNSTNRPTSNWYHAITSKGSDGNYATQFAMGMNITRLYYRNYSAAAWSAWKQVWIAGDSVTSAIWNDYAEYRETDTMEAGRCVMEVGDDSMILSTKRLQRGCSITSDTWGFAQGETEKAKTPIAVSGRVLAYPYESREEFASHIGWPVCSGPNGTVSIMTEEEEEKYPSRIIGTISAIPNYEEWGGGENADRPPVKVNGRVWIRIR